jgi:hypothetical protein
LKDLRFGVVFAALDTVDPSIHHQIVEEAYDKELIGNGENPSLWYFSSTSTYAIMLSNYTEYGDPSKLKAAYRGSGMLRTGGIGESSYDIFAKHLQEMQHSDDSMEYMFSKVPLPEDPVDKAFVTSFLQSVLDPLYMDHSIQFIYEATVLAGLAACGGVSKDLFLDGDTFYDYLYESSFQGISGNVLLDRSTGSRVANNTIYTIVNLIDDENKNPNYPVNFLPQTSDRYGDNGWEKVNPFVYFDNSTNFPSLALLYLQSTDLTRLETLTIIVVVSMMFFSISVLMAFFFAAWTFSNRRTRIVRASQPFFLYLICGGTVILGEFCA